LKQAAAMTFWRQSQGKAQLWSDTIPNVSGKKFVRLKRSKSEQNKKQNV
jgi:hypothetical protein